MPRKKQPPNPKVPWQDIAQRAQTNRDATLALLEPPLPDLPTPRPKNVFSTLRSKLSREEIQITEMLPEDLLSKMAVSELSAVRVSTAFLRRAGLAQGLTNCITELLPSRTLSRAEYLDTHLAQHAKPLGPLHGLPISVKEHIGMAGLTLSSGYVAWYGDHKIAPEDARVLQILWRAGAVFHARTTEPQTLMHLETDSNLYGVTTNPYNTDISAGGSSGGEGALVGSRGSCLGIGTDIGGSIRNPAANNGVYGFKPTAFRIPTDGWSSTAPGADPITTVIGPLSTSLAGIKLFMKTIIDTQPWLMEPELIPLPWNASMRIFPSPQRRLKIGILWHDNVVMPHPPITNAFRAVVTKLKLLSNITVVDWKPHLHDEAWAIISSLYFTDGGAEDLDVMAASGEPLRPLTRWIMKENPCVKKLSMHELYYWQEEREMYRKEYAKVWNDTAASRNDETGELEDMVDVILCPVGPGVAPLHNTAKYWGYTSQWNLLDYPSLVFPVSKVDPKVDKIEKSYRPMNNTDKDNWELYDPETFSGIPVSLQLVGRRFEDEKVLAVLDYIQQAIGLPFVDFP